MIDEKYLPVPCTNVPQRTVKEWLQKINEELDEVKEAAVKANNGIDKVIKGFCIDDATRLTEECCDLITTITSFLEYAGIDYEMRKEMQLIVNKKNHDRGYW